MKFVTTRELRLETPKILERVSRGEKIVVTSRGKPKATLLRLTEDDIEDLVLSRSSFVKGIEAARDEYDEKGGITLEEAARKLGLR